MTEQELRREYFYFHSQSIRPYQHSYSYCTSAWYYPSRRDPYNRFYVVSDGEGRLVNGSERVDLLAGRAYFIPRGRTYTMEAERRMEKFWIHFDWEVLPGLDGGELFKGCPSFPWPRELTRSWRSLCGTPSAGTANRLKGAVWMLLGSLVEEYEEEFQSRLLQWDKYKSLLRLFTERPIGTIGVRDMERCLGMSQATLYRNFSRDFSCSPRSWLIRQKMNKAETALLNTGLSVKELAYRLGWNDPSYFIRQFRKERNQSPRAFRESHRYIPERTGRPPAWTVNADDSE